jgi:tripartite-type tricarboxylate transporter receptor subunit TctC
MRLRLVLASLAAALSFMPLKAQSQSVADFYRGKSIQLMIAYSAGGGYDIEARLLARYMTKYVPGNPTIVPVNYPGAAGLRLANHLYNAALKDGTVFGSLARNASTAPLLDSKGIAFDPRRYTWIGSVSDEVSVCASWHTSKVKTFRDLMTTPFVAGAPGTISDAATFTKMIRNIFDAKIKLVNGYPGTNEITIAMERGEVDGLCGWVLGNINASHPDWIPNRKINILMQLSMKRSPSLPNAPLILDLARNEKEKQIFALMFSRQLMAWPFAAPPAVPADRAAALREAFDATMKDPDFIADSTKQSISVDPMKGVEMEALINQLYATPPDVIAAAQASIAD